MPRPWMILFIAALAACRAPVSVGPPGVEPPGPAPRAEVWVDGSARVGGDGSRARPHRGLVEALAGAPRPATVRVAPGLYAGPFVLPPGVRVEGVGATTVLYVEGLGTVARAEGGAELVGLVLQGGAWGLEGAGPLRLEGVSFSGQREGAVRLTEGRLVARASRFEAGVSESVGLRLEGRVAAEVRDSAFAGPYRDAVRAEGGAEVLLEDVRFQGPVTAVRQEGGRTHLTRVSVEGGRGPAVWVVEGAVRLESVAVTGHEFGLATHGAEVEARDFTSVRAERAGLALVRTRGRLEGIVVRDSGRFGGLQLVDSEVSLTGFRVDGADAYGLHASRGRLTARDGVLTRLRSSEGVFGDGLHLRGVIAEVEGLTVRGAPGAGVLAAQGAEVRLRDVSLSGCQQAGVVVETLASVRADGVEVSGSAGPALAVLRDGVLQVDALTSRGAAEGLLWAECEGETRVRLGRFQAEDSRGLSGPCVERLESSPVAPVTRP
ncbi:hypothetical protein P2318_07050 [Myxococcaceae bacterium GXIMD 01537]